MRELNEFLEAVESFGHVFFYRGHADASWKLLPSLARTDLSSVDSSEHIDWSGLERDVLREFEKHGCSLLENPPKNELEWLIHAQHHGLPTRLLDWSTNPLKALFFAVENPEYDHVDGVLYGVEAYLTYVMERFVQFDRYDQIVGFHSSSLNSRVIAQEGCFTLFPMPKNWEPFTELTGVGDSKNYLTSYVIPREHKAKLRKQLKKLGVTHKFLFPDLDGLAKSIVQDFGL